MAKSKMKLQREIIGSKDFGGSVDITDPCYDRDVWCRKDDVNIKKGEYLCTIWTHTSGGKNPDTRVAIIGIYHGSEIPAQESMELIGSIGVDAGLAGFFHNKPDFNDEEWAKFCGTLGNKFAWLTELGFWSSSGYGDGEFNVYASRDKNGEITALEIRFL